MGVLLIFNRYLYKKQLNSENTGLDKQKFQRKIVNIFLPINFNICFGAQKNRLIETVLLSTNNICFGREIRKINFCYALLTKFLEKQFKATWPYCLHIRKTGFLMTRLILCCRNFRLYNL